MSKTVKRNGIPVCMRLPRAILASMKAESKRLGLTFTAYVITCHNQNMERPR